MGGAALLNWQPHSPRAPPLAGWLLRCGGAVLFWSLRTDGTLDKGSLHGSCPVAKGVKYAATKW